LAYAEVPPDPLACLLGAGNVLVVGSHPDDPDAFAAGTVARWTAQGTQVSYLIVTSGDKGAPFEEPDPARFIAVREAEQRASAAFLGVEQVTFLREVDGAVFDTNELRGKIVREIRRVRPDLVLTHDPFSQAYRNHPDHRAVGQATLAALFPACRMASFFPEHLADGLEPHTVSMLVTAWTTNPNCWVDISTTFEQKVAAMRLHASQEAAFPGGIETRVRLRAEQAGAEAGLPLAEAFHFAWLD
jgi:LmbE family N-acetylglucosaminyl deacetylase